MRIGKVTGTDSNLPPVTIATLHISTPKWRRSSKFSITNLIPGVKHVAFYVCAKFHDGEVGETSSFTHWKDVMCMVRSCRWQWTKWLLSISIRFRVIEYYFFKAILRRYESCSTIYQWIYTYIFGRVTLTPMCLCDDQLSPPDLVFLISPLIPCLSSLSTYPSVYLSFWLIRYTCQTRSMLTQRGQQLLLMSVTPPRPNWCRGGRWRL